MRNFSVVVDGHEGEARIDGGIGDGQVETELLGHARPKMHRGPAQRIDGEAQTGGAHRRQIDDVLQVAHVGVEVVVLGGGRGVARALVWHPRDLVDAGRQELVGAALDGRGDVGVGRSAVGRVVFEAPVGRRVVRRRDDDAVGQLGRVRAPAIPRQDGVRDGRGRRQLVVRGDAHRQRRFAPAPRRRCARPGATPRGCRGR